MEKCCALATFGCPWRRRGVAGWGWVLGIGGGWVPSSIKSFHDVAVAGVAAIWFACWLKCNFQPRTRTQLGHIWAYYTIYMVYIWYITSWPTLLLLNLFCSQVWWIIITNKQTTAGGDVDAQMSRQSRGGGEGEQLLATLARFLAKWIYWPVQRIVVRY